MRLESDEISALFHKTAVSREDGNKRRGIEQHMGLLISGLLLFLLMIDPSWAGNEVSTTKRIRLFGTVEFRSSLKVLPQWIRVMKTAQKQIHYFSACEGDACSPIALSWKRIIRQARGKPPKEQLKLVNQFFNQWPYRLDTELYGKTDYWANPGEFMKRSGDCEDYSIAKYYGLKELNFDDRQLRIVVIRDSIRNIGHAVLAVYLDGTAYILDNLSDLVMDHGKYAHYIPQYSLNEAHHWAHVTPIGEF